MSRERNGVSGERSSQVGHVLGAVACVHVLREGAAVASVGRGEPVRSEDSGWSFVCGQEEEHSPDEMLVVQLDTLLNGDPSLEPLLQLPLGTWAYRLGPEEPWQMEPLDTE